MSGQDEFNADVADLAVLADRVIAAAGQQSENITRLIVAFGGEDDAVMPRWPQWRDKDGNPIDEREGFRLRYDLQPGDGGPLSDYARIGLDEVGEASVSTVWLGMDHQFGDGPPLIFETMIFGGEFGGECQRYSTEQQAREGHCATVAALREDRAPDWANEG